MKYGLIAATVLLTACAGAKIPELNQYLLRSDRATDSGPVSGPATIGLGNIEVADYLDHLGLVVETSSGAVRPARYHQWAEPLRESLRVFMAEEIAYHAGQQIQHRGYDGNAWKKQIPRRIDIHIEEFHGAASGGARLVASWAIVHNSEDGQTSEFKFVDSEPLMTEGYPALVRANKLLLTRLAEEIATEL